VTKQVDYTNAFVHAPIGEEEVYIEMPEMFMKDGVILKMKKLWVKTSTAKFLQTLKERTNR